MGSESLLLCRLGVLRVLRAMAPSHEDQEGQPKKFLKFAIIINNEIQTLLKHAYGQTHHLVYASTQLLTGSALLE